MNNTNMEAMDGQAMPDVQSPRAPTIDPATLTLGPKESHSIEKEQQDHSKKAYLLKYSLRGMGSELAAKAAKVEPLLGKVCLRGEATMWYAKPNAGKTLLAVSLIIDAIEQGRISGDAIVYVNMDDNSEGLAEKVSILEDHGVHVVAPGHNGFTAGKLIPALEDMILRDAVHGMVIVIDTVKKVTDLMDKKRSSEFAGWARRCVQKGGTILGLAHTNKRTGADGKLVYAGTSDIVDDFDCAYLLAEREEKTKAGHRIVEFANQKRRGNAADRAVYSYDAREGVSYRDRVGSVEALDSMDFEPLTHAEAVADIAIAGAIVNAIKAGTVQKMELIDEVRKTLKVPRRKVDAVLDYYCGSTWDFDVKDRGAKVYRLLQRPPQPLTGAT